MNFVMNAVKMKVVKKNIHHMQTNMKLIQKYEKIISKTQLKILVLCKKGKQNTELYYQYKNLIHEMELKIEACQKYGYPHSDLKI